MRFHTRLCDRLQCTHESIGAGLTVPRTVFIEEEGRVMGASGVETGVFAFTTTATERTTLEFVAPAAASAKASQVLPVIAAPLLSCLE
ncbi:hypothetical protein AWB78_05072 [Caballeronia calidae]|uniref:Uncharacterized protein n=1 Tax=Caballeronia calidae TaxID=1777139 RepID=A0A158DEG2_9BURK|nr:hypothetical protein AWB78_05072 [Caballeronia calidae]